MEEKRVTVRMSQELHEQLKIYVIKQKTNINDFLLNYIKKVLNKKEKQNNEKN